MSLALFAREDETNITSRLHNIDPDESTFDGNVANNEIKREPVDQFNWTSEDENEVQTLKSYHDDNEKVDDSAREIEKNSTELFYLFMILGLGTLFPWNALINSVDWFLHLHPDPHIDIMSKISASDLFTIVATTLLILFLDAKSQSKVYSSSALWAIHQVISFLQSPSHRIVLGFSLEICVLVTLAILPSPSVFMCKALAVLVGFGDAVSQSGAFVLAASIDPQNTVAVNIGAALSGFVASIFKLSTKAIFGSQISLDKGIFFAFASCIVGFCLWALCQIEGRITEKEKGVIIKDTKQIEVEALDIEPLHPQKVSLPTIDAASMYYEMIAVIWKPMLAVFLNFFVTLSLFPGPISSIPSNGLFGQWLPLVLITTFNLFDLIGRWMLSEKFANGYLCALLLTKLDYVPGQSPRKSQGIITSFYLPYLNKMILYPSVARLLFFPLIGACVKNVPFILFHPDVSRVLIVAVFAATNGFLATTTMAAGSTMIKGVSLDSIDKSRLESIEKNDIEMYYFEKYRDAASLLILLSLFIGLACGAYFALVVDKILLSI